jgi:glycosyltransferase involved in cell wall biosynthesis
VPNAPLLFVLPECRASITGGNLYNERLIKALVARGRTCLTMDWPEAAAWLTAGRPANVLVDSLLIDLLPSLRARSRAGQRLVLLTHFLPSLDPTADAAERLHRRRREMALLRHLDAFVVPSPLAEHAVMERIGGGPDVQILVLPPALGFRPEPRAVPTGPLRGLLVCNLLPNKGVREFLLELGRQVRTGDRFRIEIAGHDDIDPAYAASCRAAVAQAPALREGVAFLGAVPPDRIARLYARAHVFISASGFESFGMALQEARACGLYILACDAGNAAAHLAGSAGQLVPDVATLAEACARLIAGPFPSPEFEHLDHAGTPRPVWSEPDWTWNAAARRLEAFVASVVPASIMDVTLA